MTLSPALPHAHTELSLEALTVYALPIRIAVTILLAALVRWALVAIINHTVKRVTLDAEKRRKRVRAAKEEGKKAPKQFPLSPLAAERVVQRTRALASLSRNIVTVVVVVVTLIVILSDLGVNLTALLASAGIVAAGLAFGAQNIVKDLINGVFMVFEDQIGVGDSVIIGDVEGTVEVVGLRITQVRAFDGTLWFIRNGEILRLGNQSHGWGRAIVDVSVSPENDLDEVQRIIAEVAETVTKLPKLRSKVTSKPELFAGLVQVSEDRVTVRVTVKTVAEAQGDVERELRSALKGAFDQAGIRFAPDKSTIILRTGGFDDQE